MVNALQHELAKWLATIFQPVVQKFSEHAVKDSFEFCANLKLLLRKQIFLEVSCARLTWLACLLEHSSGGNNPDLLRHV